MREDRSDGILARTRAEQERLTGFLQDLVRIPSPSGQEGPVVRRIQQEMEAVGFDEVKIDPLGNVLGRIGDGDRVLAFDAHVDTVGVTDRSAWSCDPYGAELRGGCLYGRGAVDQKAGMAAMVYAGKILKDLDLAPDLQIWMVGSVQEEDCDGLCWLYILREKVLAPEFVVLTEPTDLHLYRGQRGRLEMRVSVRGRSCHGSMPELGDNAIVKLAPAIAALTELNERLAEDPFLGRGTVAVTWMHGEGPSLCAVPDRAALHLDRRLTAGEDPAGAVREVQQVLGAAGVEGEVVVPTYKTPSWTGLVYPMEQAYPTWTLPADHPGLHTACSVHRRLFGREAEVGRWRFSTNGVTIAGIHSVPCLGFGPGREALAHMADEHVPVEAVASACAFYAALADGWLDG
jgi:putative selenium metabolism hydrolase